MISLKKFESFDPEKFGDPWVAELNEEGAPVFDNGASVGGYTGGFKTGHAGEAYVNEPEEGKIYACGQKSKVEGVGNVYTEYFYYSNGNVFEFSSASARKLAAGADPMELLEESYQYHVEKAAEIQEQIEALQKVNQQEETE